MWSAKSIDVAEARLVARLVESGSFAQVTWLSLGNNQIGDDGIATIAAACRGSRLAQLKELSLSALVHMASRGQVSCQAAWQAAVARCDALRSQNQPATRCTNLVSPMRRGTK